MPICDLDTQEITPEGTASLAHWIKATVRSVTLGGRMVHLPPTNAELKTTEEAIDVLHTQALWD